MNQYLQCVGWSDVGSCLPSTNNSNSTFNKIHKNCSSIITKDRYGYCECHNSDVHLWQYCARNNLNFTCNDICNQGIGACGLTSNIGTVFTSDSAIVGCKGEWFEPGFANAENFCSSNYHICSSIQEIDSLGLEELDCSLKADPFSFYASRLHSKYYLFGCADANSMNILPISNSASPPLMMSLNYQKILSMQNENSWRVWQSGERNSDSQFIFNSVFKINNSNGGVLCCTNQSYYDLLNLGTLLLQSLAFVIAFSTIIFCVWKGLNAIGQAIIRRCSFCQRCREWNGILRCFCCFFPTSKAAWRILKEQRALKKIPCKSFEDVENEEISKDSASCAICMEDYNQDSEVLFLKCGHHFHRSCAYQWLEVKAICPLCLQNFKTAENKYSKKNEHEIEDISNSLQEVKVIDCEKDVSEANEQSCENNNLVL